MLRKYFSYRKRDNNSGRSMDLRVYERYESFERLASGSNSGTFEWQEIFSFFFLFLLLFHWESVVEKDTKIQLQKVTKI